MNSFEEVYRAVEDYCFKNGKVGTTAKNLWLDSLKPARLEGNDAVFYCSSVFQKDIVMDNYAHMLTDAFEQILGFPVQLRLIVMEEEDEKQPSSPENFDELQQSLERDFDNADYAYTFDTFIVGKSNEFAYAACLSVAQSNGTQPYNPLFIYGPSGLGKTHLLIAISHEMKKKNPDLNIIYVTGETFANELIEAIHQKKDTSRFHEKYRSADVLLVDDVQFISGKEQTQEEFFHTFNKLHSEKKQIVLTSDRSPNDIRTLTDRIRSRFISGLVADVSAPDFETRVAIIRRKAELLELNIPDDVAEFIANKLKSNIRQLEGAVKKIKALKQLANSSPSISMAQSVIREILTDEQPTPVTVEHIIQEVSNLYGVSPEDIRSSKRAQQISNARKIAIYLVREITNMPLNSIGEEFGGRDHSTVVYACKNVQENLAKDSNLRDAVESIIKTIRDGSQ